MSGFVHLNPQQDYLYLYTVNLNSVTKCTLVSGFVHLEPAKAGVPLHLGCTSVHPNPANLTVEVGSGVISILKGKDKH